MKEFDYIILGGGLSGLTLAYELNKQGLSLVKSEIEDIWILTLSNEASKVRWIDALPKSYKNESWAINTDIEIQLVIAHD